jgi:hypothetical protein
MPMNLSCVLASGTFVLLAPFAAAQARAPLATPAPLPGLPITTPPVDHPALAGQPLIGDNGRKSGGGRGAGPAGPAAPVPPPVVVPPPPPKVDPDTSGQKRAGKDLKKAVVEVTKTLKWHESLAEAKAQSAATSKPILLLQALGDIDGFA